MKQKKENYNKRINQIRLTFKEKIAFDKAMEIKGNGYTMTKIKLLRAFVYLVPDPIKSLKKTGKTLNISEQDIEIARSQNQTNRTRFSILREEFDGVYELQQKLNQNDFDFSDVCNYAIVNKDKFEKVSKYTTSLPIVAKNNLGSRK